MKYSLALVFVVLFFGCSREPELTQDEILNSFESKKFDALVGWDIVDRGNLHVFYKNVQGENTDRWLVINKKGKITFKRILPFRDKDFTSLNGNTEFDLAFAIYQFYDLEVDELRYSIVDSVEFLTIKKNGFDFLYTFQDSLDYLPERLSNWDQKTSNLYIRKQE